MIIVGEGINTIGTSSSWIELLTMTMKVNSTVMVKFSVI